MLTQNGTQRIEVIIRKGSGSLSQAGNNEKEPDGVSGGADEEDPRGSSYRAEQRRRRIIKTNLTHALAVTKQVVDLGIEYEVAGIGFTNGDQALQQRVSRQVEVVKDATNFVSSIAQGALYGSWGGPIGAVLGMVFAAASTGASLLVKYKSRGRDYDYKVFKENNAIEYMRSRANINLTTGRLR